MPEVLDRVPFFTDPENAKQAALRKADLDRQSKQELANLRLILQTSPIDSTQTSVQQPQPTIDITRTREQLDALDLQLADCKDPKDWDALTRAKERLFRIWAHLAGIPGPGNLKPSAPARQRRSLPEPTPLAADVSSTVQPPDTQG